jgi:hypothetical protein
MPSNFTEWLTLAGALGAFIVGSINLWWQRKDRTDDIHVTAGGLSPSMTPHTMLTVTNRSKHSVRLHDYGVILFNGQLRSWRWAVESDGDLGQGGPDIFLAKKRLLE